jgi:hypothetical protein
MAYRENSTGVLTLEADVKLNLLSLDARASDTVSIRQRDATPMISGGREARWNGLHQSKRKDLSKNDMKCQINTAAERRK